MSYSELFCQSNFSFLTGASHPEELVTTAAFLGYQAIALTDECSVAGIVRAWAEIQSQKLPITLITGSFFTLDETFSFVLLCPDKQAYSELCRLITKARRRAEKGCYQLNEWDIRSLKHCLGIWLPTLNEKQDDQWASWLQYNTRIPFWIGAQRLLDGTDTKRFTAYQSLSERFKLPITACTGALFHHPSRQPIQHVLHAIAKGTTVEKLGFAALSNCERSLRTLQKLNHLYPAHWLAESVRISEQCQFNLSELKYQYPAEVVPVGKTPMEYLKECVALGCTKRFPNGVPTDIQHIIDKELTLIESQEYAYFFLTIYDIVQFAQSQGILYQGRGSAANSVVCYCLEITAVDPRQINVLFERFISKERNEPPDIDVDFEHERREEVIQYIYRKYGRERTALAATVISFRFKSAFREVGKALGFPESQLDYWIKQLNLRDRSIGWKAQLTEIANKNSQNVLQLLTLTEEILGFPRHLSQHVGGFVISAGPLYDLVPVENAAMEDRTVIQWDKDDLESLGLLKVDVLALGMLTAIRKAFDMIFQHYQHNVSIPLVTSLGDDKQVYQMICNADTVGVFQIESRAQMSMLPRLKPQCYYDLVVQIAIVRPGPIQGDMVHPYLKRRHKEESISYPSEEVKSVLSRTMGVPIFQEQVIQLAMVAAGFTGGEADQLRRAMASWKKNGKLHQFREKLITGMTSRGYKEDFASQIFDQICGFGEYGFPESHSASFAVLAYTSSWLKYYYPGVFYTALLNSLPMGFYSASQLLQDARRHHIKIGEVCINSSEHDYTYSPQQNAIQVGLRQIKGLSSLGAQTLCKQRPKTGYTSVAELHNVVNQADIEALASANALRAIAGHRYQARWSIMDTQPNLPLFVDEQSTDVVVPPTSSQNLIEDYAALSLSVNQHPIALLRKHHRFAHLTWANQINERTSNKPIKVIGCVTGRQAPGTAGGVTFITLEDDTGNMNVVVWQSTARAQKVPYISAKILEVHGILERSKEGVCHIIAGKLIDKSHLLSSLSASSRDFH